MSKFEPIKNTDKVMAYHEDGTVSERKWSNLKQDFISNNVLVPVKKVRLIKTGRYYFVIYHPTKGFKYESL